RRRPACRERYEAAWSSTLPWDLVDGREQRGGTPARPPLLVTMATLPAPSPTLGRACGRRRGSYPPDGARRRQEYPVPTTGASRRPRLQGITASAERAASAVAVGDEAHEEGAHLGDVLGGLLGLAHGLDQVAQRVELVADEADDELVV